MYMKIYMNPPPPNTNPLFTRNAIKSKCDYVCMYGEIAQSDLSNCVASIETPIHGRSRKSSFWKSNVLFYFTFLNFNFLYFAFSLLPQEISASFVAVAVAVAMGERKNNSFPSDKSEWS